MYLVLKGLSPFQHIRRAYEFQNPWFGAKTAPCVFVAVSSSLGFTGRNVSKGIKCWSECAERFVGNHAKYQHLPADEICNVLISVTNRWGVWHAFPTFRLLPCFCTLSCLGPRCLPTLLPLLNIFHVFLPIRLSIIELEGRGRPSGEKKNIGRIQDAESKQKAGVYQDCNLFLKGEELS